MSLPLSGPISLSDVNTTLSLSANTPITMDQTTVRSLTEYSSGEIKFSDLYGKYGGSLVTSGVPRNRNITIDGSIISNAARLSSHAGVFGSYIISKTNQVYGWGRTQGGAGYTIFYVGNNVSSGSTTPLNISSYGSIIGSNIVAISINTFAAIVLDSQGQVHTWGPNSEGQAGNNTDAAAITSGGNTNRYRQPINISTYGSLSGKIIIACSAGAYHCMALDSQGGVHTWGYNLYGQLGNGTITNSLIPISISNYGSLVNKTIVHIKASTHEPSIGASDRASSFAIDSSGGLHGWGSNTPYNIIVNNSPHTNITVPTQITHGSLAGVKIVAVACGAFNALALDTTGSLHSWGRSDYIGIGSTSSAAGAPIIINNYGSLSGKTIKTMTCGGNHSLVLDSDGKVHAWGYNQYGGIGIGTTAFQYSPVIVSDYGSLVGKTVVSIHAGVNSSMAIDSTNTIHTWGYNYYYAGGTGTTTNSLIPVSIGVLE